CYRRKLHLQYFYSDCKVARMTVNRTSTAASSTGGGHLRNSGSDVTHAVAIEATGLTKRFGDLLAVDSLDLSVPSGTVFSLLGPNGAGKTTTVRMLATLLAPDAGSARINGYD